MSALRKLVGNKAAPVQSAAAPNPAELADPSDGVMPDDSMRLWGIENFNNTCYCASMLQALYACDAFRQFVEAYPDVLPPQSPLGPPPGTANQPLPLREQNNGGDRFPGSAAGGTGKLSPLPTNRTDPFDGPAGKSPMSPTGGKEKSRWGLRRSSTAAGIPTIASTPPVGSLHTPILPEPPIPAPKGGDPRLIASPAKPNSPPLTLFQTIQTLFYHLSNSPPHQPLPRSNTQAAQTDSLILLPAGPDPAPLPSAPGSPTPAGSSPGQPGQANPAQPTPPANPMLASLPPPSSARGSGPWQAGKLGRGVVRPTDVLLAVRRAHRDFDNGLQHDAHEFLGMLLNKIEEEVEEVDRKLKAEGKEVAELKWRGKNFVQALFQGVLANETKCLSCQSVSSREEAFIDLSIDIEQNTSITHNLRQFSASEMLSGKNKFYCDSCCGLQEAEKSMKIKRVPQVLALHLKRFEHLGFDNRPGRKLFCRCPFPVSLRLPNTTDDTEDPDKLYELFAVNVHIGNSPAQGHYVSLVRCGDRWVMCDDDNVDPIDDDQLFHYFGDHIQGQGYVLFYQAAGLSGESMGLAVKPKAPPAVESAYVSAVGERGEEGVLSAVREGEGEVGERAREREREREKKVVNGFATRPVGLGVNGLEGNGRGGGAEPQAPPVAQVSTPAPAPAPVPAPTPAPSKASVQEPKRIPTNPFEGPATPFLPPPRAAAAAAAAAPAASGTSQSVSPPAPALTHVVSSPETSGLDIPTPRVNGTSTPERQLGFNAAPAVSAASASASAAPAPSSAGNGTTSARPTSSYASAPQAAPARPPSQARNGKAEEDEKDKKKWYRMSVSGRAGDKDKRASVALNGSRPSTGQTSGDGDLPHGVTGTGGTPTLSSSMMSSVSATSGGASTSGHTQASQGGASLSSSTPTPNQLIPPPASFPAANASPSVHGNPPSQPPSSMSSSQASALSALGRKPSLSGKERERQASGSSAQSGSGSLGRKLSGMGGKLGRSGSMAFGKMGFGKKDGIQEEKRREEEKGLLGRG